MAAPSTRLPCLGCWLILVAFAGLRAYAAGGAQNAPSPAAPPAVGSLREARTPELEAPLPESDPAPEVASRADYRVDLWTTDQGLPQNTVQSLHQTQDGYLWVGTQSGLARFDGLHFTVFDRNNTPAFKSDNILCLAESADHTLWIGTSDGLVRLRDHVFTYCGLEGLNPQPWRHVWAICADDEAGPWIGADGALARFLNGQLLAQTNLQPATVRSLVMEQNGSLWVGSDAGLFRCSTDFGAPARVYLGYDAPLALCSDRHHDLWFGTRAGLWRWRDGRLKAYGSKDGLSPGGVGSIAEDSEGALWLTVNHSVHRLRKGKFTAFDTRTGLPDCTMYCVAPDREGNVWIGTRRDGLVRLRPGSPLVTYTTQEGLVDDDVWSICQGHAGDMWFGTPHGVSRFMNEQFTNYPKCWGPVLADRSGALWCQRRESESFLPELNTLRDNQWGKNYGPAESPLFGRIASIYQDRSNAVWVAVGAGLWRLAGEDCTLYQVAGNTDTLPASFNPHPGRHYTIERGALPGPAQPLGTLEDYQGQLWVGSRGSGLHCFRNGQFTTLTTTDGLTSDFVGPLLADPDGALWIGSDKGLNRLKNGHITRYTTVQGLAENIVGNLLEDDEGWFWTMGHRGLHRMRKQELIDLAEGRRGWLQAFTYGAADGLLGSEANVGLFPNACRTSDGLLWFPTTRGVVVIEPHLMQTHDRPPPVVLEQVLANDEAIFGDGAVSKSEIRNPKSEIRLPAGGARVLEFRFTANTFVAPDQVRFKYQLVGHDRDWRIGGSRRTASYTDIAPGTYCFRVAAINNHGVESEAPAKFAFSLAPFFYRTPWFYAGVSVGALLVVLGCHRLRVSALARRQALEQQLALALQRERIARDMHDDLGASLTQIGLLSEHARRNPDKPLLVAADVEKIADAARATALAAEEIVWTVNPRHDTLDSLATYLCQFTREYLEPSALRCRLDVPELLPDWRVPSEKRHGLVLFVKEALNNAVKHSSARQVSVALNLDGRTLSISVTDDGCGLDPQLSTLRSAATEDGSTLNLQPSANGNGLASMRHRVEGIGGEFQLSSLPGQGTRVSASVRLDA